MPTKNFRYAAVLALSAAAISGTNNFLTKAAVTAIKDPILFTTLKNAAVAVLLLGLILGLRKWSEIRNLNQRQWLKLILIGVIGGALPFALFFTGLAQTSALNGSLIHKTLFFWVLLFAVPFLRERVQRWQWLGVSLIFAANFLVGGFAGFKFNAGELMILGATVLWAVENVLAKKALADISSLTVASARMTIGSFLLFLFLVSQGRLISLAGLSAAQWGWTLLTSGLLLGYVLTWYTALKYAPATYVAALLVPATLVTNILSAIFVTHSFGGFPLISSLFYLGGILIFIYGRTFALRPLCFRP